MAIEIAFGVGVVILLCAIVWRVVEYRTRSRHAEQLGGNMFAKGISVTKAKPTPGTVESFDIRAMP